MTDSSAQADHNGPLSHSAETEIAKERTYGGAGVEVDKSIPIVDLANENQNEIDDQLWQAAVEIGFFQLVNHGIAQERVERAFAMSEAFFALDHEVKARRSIPNRANSGWEYKSQVRPSTGTTDAKESFQVTISRMDDLDLWPEEQELAGFRAEMEDFEAINRDLAMRVLESFARKLGFEDDFFAKRHDRSSAQYQSTLRLLHYLPLDAVETDPSVWRAGAHTDFDCLTLLHQQPGQFGLQVSPGRDDEGGSELEWTPVEPMAGRVTCNIGDMLVRWSDDALRSTLHRVRMPREGEYLGPRYSLAYFAQADCDAIIEGPGKRYEAITASDYLQQRIAANFPKG